MADPIQYTYVDDFSTGAPPKVYEVPVYKTLRSALMNTSALQPISRR
ncbi:hypothetical protein PAPPERLAPAPP_00520 [Brevundimonas phage vB_BpoS-Papperlapapp]|uniref:Uncharacterized protein n=1 Tax=Brevundimonas phage vB_BpoS-Domovoi TaxID=2948598 RepID=A0A9E7SKX7_9CAUD|nr:hypothetical protein DOMOVOI_05290 [Brevundimonas phage vB_BpoS-Domovoi]USN15794.1 hypothetical protein PAPPERLAPAPP_00520 [Brevundimonas phage vB_BpoS-Papperlapapp]